MTLDSRGRRAGGDFRDAIDDLETSAPERGSFARFERVRVRKLRNRRIGAGLLGVGLAVAAIAFVAMVFSSVDRERPAAPTLPDGVILYGDWDAEAQRADWYSMYPDGTVVRDLDRQCHVRRLAPGREWHPDHGRRSRGRGSAAAPRAGRRGWIEPSSPGCDEEPRSEPRVRGRLARWDADRPRGVRPGRTS